MIPFLGLTSLLATTFGTCVFRAFLYFLFSPFDQVFFKACPDSLSSEFFHAFFSLVIFPGQVTMLGFLAEVRSLY